MRTLPFHINLIYGGNIRTFKEMSLVDLSQEQLNFEKVTKEVVYEVTSLYIESAIDQKTQILLLQSLDSNLRH